MTSTNGDRRGARLADLIGQIREDWRSHERDWTRPGFRALAAYRLGVWRLGLRDPVLRRLTWSLYTTAHRRVRNAYGIELHYTARLGRRVRLWHHGGIVIHMYAEIGDDCLILHDVTLGAANDFESESPPRLERGVQVGAGAKIVGGVTIGEGARVGANAVVIADVPPGATAFAPPARLLKEPPSS